VQGQGADNLHGRELLRNNLRRVQKIDALEHLLLCVREHLDAKVPLGERASLDGIGEVATMEIGIHTASDLCFLPYLGVDTETRLEVEFYQGGLPRHR